jgi:hypothetical protein
MTTKHIAIVLAATLLLLMPLSGFPAQSQGVLKLLQDGPTRHSSEQTDYAPPRVYVPPDGYVPDAETAIKIGMVIIEQNFGEIPAQETESITATLQDGIWIVKRKPVPGGLDGGAEVHISKKDGAISFLSNML